MGHNMPGERGGGSGTGGPGGAAPRVAAGAAAVDGPQVGVQALRAVLRAGAPGKLCCSGLPCAAAEARQRAVNTHPSPRLPPRGYQHFENRGRAFTSGSRDGRQRTRVLLAAAGTGGVVVRRGGGVIGWSGAAGGAGHTCYFFNLSRRRLGSAHRAVRWAAAVSLSAAASVPGRRPVRA